MIKSILTAAVAAFAFAGAASAEGEFDVSFTYDPAASAEVTYDAFQSQAKRACRIDLRRVGSIAMKTKLERACQQSLVDSVVSATRDASLIALHMGEPVSAQPIDVAAKD
ncbi:MAG: hypothetical protein AAFQ21_06345 [Pseudomonadota bacterium]